MKRTLPIFYTCLLCLCAGALWAQPANNDCSGAIPLPQFPAQQTCENNQDDGVSYTVTTSGSNVGATPQTPSPELSCTDGTITGPSASVFYTFRASGAINEITVNSGGLNGIQVIGYVGDDCDNLNVRDCATGSGSVTVRIIAQPGQQVFFSVSGEAGDPDDQGNFDIEVTSSSDCDACAREDNGEVIFNPRNASGTYACGSTVEICFTLFEYDGNDAGSVEWLHSIVPTFGSGWDVSTLTPTVTPPACNGNGSWGWYPNGWTSCETGQSYPYGFAFESSAGNDASCPGTNNPGNNWGDGGNGCTSLPAATTWCFALDVLACPPGSGTFTGDDLTVSIQVFSDGFSGSWNQQVCAAPVFTGIGSVIVCNDLEPIATATPESCPGANDGFLEIEGNGGVDPGTLYNFVVRDASSTAIFVCNACPSPVNTGALPAGNYTIEATGIVSGCPQTTMATIDPGVAPPTTADHTVVCPGQGPIQLLGSTTASGSSITYAWEGPNNFTATGASPFTNDPAAPGTYTLTVTVDGCEGDPVDVEVEYVDFFPVGTATPENVCFGDEVNLQIDNVGAGATFVWYDPDGNLLPGTGNSITATTSMAGQQNYLAEVTEGSCTELVPVPVTVADEILAEISLSPDGQVCRNSEITFTAQRQGGGAFPAGWSFDWSVPGEGNPGSGPTYVRDDLNPGNYQVDLIVTNPDGCSQPFSEVFIVNPLPDIQISPAASTICGTGSVELIPTITDGEGPFTYLWGPDEAAMVTTPTFTVDANSTITEALYVIVTDNNGCVGYSNFADVEIVSPPPAVSIDCEVISIDSLEFTWNDVGQEEFEVYISIGGAAETLIADDYTGLSYLVENLPENTTVSIRVIPLGGTGGQSCPGPESSQSCTTLSCPNVSPPTVTCGATGLDFVEINWTDVGADSYTVDVVSAPPGAMTSVSGTTFTATGLNAGDMVTITVTAVTQAGCPNPVSTEVTCTAQSCLGSAPAILTPVDTFCADGSVALIDLTTDYTGAGTLSWSGPGVTGDQFDPFAAGAGFHDITVVLTEGTCTYASDFELGVVAPLPNLSLSGSPTFCVGDTAAFTIDGAVPAGFTLEWIIPSGSVIISGGNDLPAEPLVITVNDIGDNDVRAVFNNGVCSPDTLQTGYVVFDAPGPIAVDCENISFDQVGFAWSQPEGLPVSYVVDDMPAGAMVTDNGNSILVTGLAEGESVTITVSASSTNVCSDPAPVTLTCTAASCPVVSVALDPIGPFCPDTEQTVALTTTITSVDNNGMLSYLPAPGVVGTDFVTTGLPAGLYEVIASYTEAGCTFNDTIVVEVTPAPVADFTLAATTACTGQGVGADAGAMISDMSYDWIADPADATVVTNSPVSISVSWATAGTKTIGLALTNALGCTSDTLFRQVEVEAPLAAPTIGCGVSSFTSVEFGWDPIPGAAGYAVSVDNGPVFNQDSTSLLVDGLNQGDLVNIEVFALGTGPCMDGPAASQQCEVGSCPTITVIPMDDQAFCTGSTANVVTLTASQSGGAGTGTYVFSGAGVTENNGVYTFDADAAGPGVHTIDVLYSEAICTGMASLTMTVTQTPGSPFTLNGAAGPLTVCANDDFSIAYTGGLDAAAGAVFTWGFAGATANPTAVFENYTASFSAPGVYDITLTVTLNGCAGPTTVLPVTVEAPLEPLVINCTDADLNSVTFSWNDVAGATGYQLSDGTVLPAGTTEYTVTGVLPGQDTTITLFALSGSACANGASTTSQPCAAQECPDLTLDATNVVSQVCLENGDETIDLSAAVVTGGTGNGSFIFSGPGVSGTTFDAAAAGGNEAGMVHTISVEYTEEGPCAFNGTFDLTVFERPSAFITDAQPACTGDGVQLTVGSTNFVANQNITIDFDGGTILDDGDPDDSVYLVAWDTPGTKTVTATVVSNISGCESLPVLRDVVIEAPLQAPVVSCPATAELESVTFSWEAVTGANGYAVSTSLGDTTVLDAATTDFTVAGLMPETTVSISVTALGNGPCGNSLPGTQSCETAPCPGGTVQALTPPTDLCLDGEQESFPLSAELDMGMPTGPFVWSGTGVVDNGNGTYSFDPTGLSAGEYLLTVTYLGEAGCTSTDDVMVRLFAQPVADFTLSADVVCTDTDLDVELTGAVDPAANYTWDFAGAALTPGTDPETYTLRWPVAGTHTILLTAEANGCQTISSLTVTVEEPAVAGVAVSNDEAYCAGSPNDIDLNTFLSGADEGGTWSVAPGSPGNVGNTDVSSGVFNTAALSAGDYVFQYEVLGGSCPPATTEVSLSLLPPPVADAGPTQTLTCTMGMVRLDGTASDAGDGVTYRWFSEDPGVVITGGDQTTLDVSQPGMYFLEVTNAIGCSSVDGVMVQAETEAPVMEVEVSNITCFSADDGAILVTSVNGGRAPYTFTLNGEERGAATLFSGLIAQEYDLRVSDANGCFSNLILDLTEPEELTVRLQFPGDSTEVTAGDEITIVASVNGGNPLDTLIWMPDSIDTGESRNGITFTASETQMISVMVVDELGCTATDREMLIVRKERPVYFPNVFSPNGDNINDVWFIGGDLNQIDFIDNFYIFDRWGEVVYQGGQVNAGSQAPGAGDGERFLPNDPAFGWDGTVNGKAMNPQVLVYTATVHFSDGEVIVYKGDFILMR